MSRNHLTARPSLLINYPRLTMPLLLRIIGGWEYSRGISLLGWECLMRWKGRFLGLRKSRILNIPKKSLLFLTIHSGEKWSWPKPRLKSNFKGKGKTLNLPKNSKEKTKKYPKTSSTVWDSNNNKSNSKRPKWSANLHKKNKTTPENLD